MGKIEETHLTRERLEAPKNRGRGAGVSGRGKLALLTTKEAAAYLGVDRKTLARYAKQGKLVAENQAGEGHAHLFSTRQLDNLRLALSVRHSNTGKAKIDQQKLAQQIDQQLLALVEKGSSTIVKEALEAGKQDGEIQGVMREQIAALIVNNKLFERLTVLALHPRPDVQLKAIATLTSYVLPRLQSTEVVMKADPGEEKFKKEMLDKMEVIRLDMEKARHISYGPTTDAELVDDAPHSERAADTDE